MSESATAVGLAALVAVVGMPHGGLDHLFGRAVFQPATGRWWRAAFAAAYLGVAAVVVAGWFVSPAVTVVAFFLVSAAHFGDDPSTRPLGVVDGGMVAWVPLLARPGEVAGLLAWVVPDGDSASVRAAVEAVRPFLCGVAAVSAGHVLMLAAGGRWPTAVRLAVFAGLFAGLPVLVSFGLYFCGWHSTREMAALARLADPARPWRGLRAVVRLAAPRAAVAVVGTGLAAWWFAAGRDVTPVVVQAVFLGLSAVAVPHILLHAAAGRLRVDPFAPSGLGAGRAV